MSAEQNAPAAGADQVEVRLVGLPLDVQRLAMAHLAALQREFDVLLSTDDHASVPQELLSLVAELESRYGALTAVPEAEMDAARDRGERSIDVTYHVPSHLAGEFRRLRGLLEDLDDYCRQGDHLLTLAAAPDVVRYRRWILGEFVDQLGGAAPTPWGETVPIEEITLGDEPVIALPEPEYRLPAGWSVEERADDVVVRPQGELDLQTAPELRELVLLARREHTSVVEIDLRAVTFVDSVGLSVFVSAHQRLSADGVELVVVVPAPLRPLFELSGLGSVLELRG